MGNWEGIRDSGEREKVEPGSTGEASGRRSQTWASVLETFAFVPAFLWYHCHGLGDPLPRRIVLLHGGPHTWPSRLSVQAPISCQQGSGDQWTLCRGSPSTNQKLSLSFLESRGGLCFGPKRMGRTSFSLPLPVFLFGVHAY